MALALVPACKSRPDAPPPASEFPAYRQLAEQHNARVALVQTLYASGIIEIRWRDKKGKHVEQGNMEMWLHLPRRTALRVEKLGEVLLWLGSDETQSWLFDLTGEERVLYLGQHEVAVQRNEQGIIGVTPSNLLDLMGLMPLPPDDDLHVQYSRERKAWLIETQGFGAPVRVYFDRISMLPVRVESLAPNGAINFTSVLSRHDSVRIQGIAAAAFPKLPHLIDISSEGPEGTAIDISSGTVKIAITSTSASPESDQLMRVFDLQRLTQALRPSRIEPPGSPQR